MLGVILDNPSLGWDFYKKLKENGVTIVSGNGDVIKPIASGEKTVGIVVDFMAFTAKDKGAPVEFVYPKEGIITLTEPIALIKKKKMSMERLENATKFVQFVLSLEGQSFAKKQGYKSIREADHADSKMIPLNTKKLLMEIETHKKEFAALFGR